MRKFLLPLALVATLATGTAAFAATNSAVTGTVTKVDLKGETVTLGKVAYHFAKGFEYRGGRQHRRSRAGQARSGQAGQAGAEDDDQDDEVSVQDQSRIV